MNVIDKYGLLNQQQVGLLNNCVSIPFQLKKYKSLDNILSSLNVDVVIEPGIVTRAMPTALDAEEAFWCKEVDRIKSEIHDEVLTAKDLENARGTLDEIRKNKEIWCLMRLRGLYDHARNVIVLYPEEMKQEYNGMRMNELLVSTLAHETMHAYFNRPRHKSFPYVTYVEEPLAEFGMLLYLHETGSSFYQWAYQDVSKKRTCYRFGVKYMDQHLQHGSNSAERQLLEAYKIKLNDYPTINSQNGITIPISSIGNGKHSPVKIGGQTIHPKWQDIFKFPPSYFYEQSTQTLGLDGEWGHDSRKIQNQHLPIHVMFDIDIDIDMVDEISNHISKVYLGDNFTIHHDMLYDLLSEYDIVVSPRNKQFYAKHGVPVLKKDNTPALNECGKGLYELSRNGKWGVVDSQLNQIIPFIYDDVWSYDANDLMMVRISKQYGLVDLQGNVQVPIIYEHITENQDGTYTVKKSGSEFRINKYGNRI